MSQRVAVPSDAVCRGVTMACSGDSRTPGSDPHCVSGSVLLEGSAARTAARFLEPAGVRAAVCLPGAVLWALGTWVLSSGCGALAWMSLRVS